MNFLSSLFWLLGFLCGSVAGMQTDAFVISWSFESALPFLMLSFLLPIKGKFKNILLLFAGLVWGASHSSPSPHENLTEVQVFQKNLLPFGSGMLVRSLDSRGTSHYFFANGSGRVGERGQTFHYPKESVYPPDRNQFKGFFPHTRSEPKIFSSITRSFEQRIVGISPRVQGFLYSVIAGDKDHLGTELWNAFIKLGIVHLLVVSGLHVSFISSVCLRMIFFPFQITYCLCLMKPRVWYHLSFLLHISSAALVFLYAAAIGFPSSVQRAVLLFSLDQFVKIFGLSLSIKSRMASTLVLQTVFFALDVLSIGSLLSWFCYLTVYSLAVGAIKGSIQILQCQLALCFFTSALLGQVSVIGFFLNLIVVPVFPLIVIWMIPLLLHEICPQSLIQVGIQVQNLFLDAMKGLSDRLEDLPFLYFEISQWAFLRGTLFLLAVGCLISLLRNTAHSSDC